MKAEELGSLGEGKGVQDLPRHQAAQERLAGCQTHTYELADSMHDVYSMAMAVRSCGEEVLAFAVHRVELHLSAHFSRVVVSDLQ